MKYKKQIATGALALSLLIGGPSTIFATTPQDLGIKTQLNYQKPIKNNKNLRINGKGRYSTVGIVMAIGATDFTMEVKNLKTKIISSVDVKTDAQTKYIKNGVSATLTEVIQGHKVIVSGTLDKTTNIITAKKVKIV